MEVKYLVLLILSTLFSICNAVIIRNNHRSDRRDDNNHHPSSNIIQRRKGNDRVQIRVYRGPETEHNGKKFAPWGFLVRQPADD